VLAFLLAFLAALRFDLSERAIACYLWNLRRRGDPKQRWRAFLGNHHEAIVSVDFFTVPTMTFQVLYCFFVIEHERLTILHLNVTRHPSSAWVVQQPRSCSISPVEFR
jgi:hypothetical protein